MNWFHDIKARPIAQGYMPLGPARARHWGERQSLTAKSSSYSIVHGHGFLLNLSTVAFLSPFPCLCNIHFTSHIPDSRKCSMSGIIIEIGHLWLYLNWMLHSVSNEGSRAACITSMKGLNNNDNTTAYKYWSSIPIYYIGAPKALVLNKHGTVLMWICNACKNVAFVHTTLNALPSHAYRAYSASRLQDIITLLTGEGSSNLWTLQNSCQTRHLSLCLIWYVKCAWIARSIKQMHFISFDKTGTGCGLSCCMKIPPWWCFPRTGVDGGEQNHSKQRVLLQDIRQEEFCIKKDYAWRRSDGASVIGVSTCLSDL